MDEAGVTITPIDGVAHSIKTSGFSGKLSRDGDNYLLVSDDGSKHHIVGKRKSWGRAFGDALQWIEGLPAA